MDARIPADLTQPASQTMPAIMGAGLGHLCALQHGDGTVNRPADTGGSGLSAGCSRRGPACGIVHRGKMGAVRRPDNRDRELEVIAVEAGAGRAAFLPVMQARPSRVAK
jgi:hypothetical protein